MITWIKLSTALFDDEKVAIIESMPEADSLLVMWVKLLIQAGKCNAGGWVWLEEGRPYTEEMLASVLRRPLNTVRLALQTFRELGMVEVSERGILILSWARHQNIEGMEHIRELARLRKQKQRSALKTEAVTPLSLPCHANVTHTDKELDLDKEQDKETERDVTLTGAAAPFDPFTCCNTFADYRNLLDGYDNQVGFLVGAFKRIHRDAPASDFEDPGGRLGKLWAKNNRDTGYILKVMWDISTAAIAGSHMDFLHKALEARKSKSKPAADPDKFVHGKYGHMVQR